MTDCQTFPMSTQEKYCGLEELSDFNLHIHERGIFFIKLITSVLSLSKLIIVQ